MKYIFRTFEIVKDPPRVLELAAEISTLLKEEEGVNVHKRTGRSAEFNSFEELLESLKMIYLKEGEKIVI